jgi:hypothetical protein
MHLSHNADFTGARGSKGIASGRLVLTTGTLVERTIHHTSQSIRKSRDVRSVQLSLMYVQYLTGVGTWARSFCRAIGFQSDPT